MRVVTLVGVLLLSACTTAPVPDPRPAPTASVAPASVSTALPPVSAAPASVSVAPVAQRDCASLVSVGLGGDAWRAAPVAGPAAFGALDYRWGDRAAFAERAPDAQGWRRFKVALRLRGGTPATVTVPAARREVAALTYRNGLDDTVSFAACGAASDPPTSEFAGGFAVREAVCLPVEVTWPDGTARVVLDFGVGGC
ncbi:hypothetical protein ACQEVZ_50740 [Dactylosporangium sp. CA-152071]|uniref:hypothetical protein n=1 Tax=Dactylosporangium sp. CA-152071 TaxID=3239933 RepID=UPI003D8C1289